MEATQLMAAERRRSTHSERWELSGRLLASGYRIGALVLGSAHLLLGSAALSLLPPGILISILSAYTAAIAAAVFLKKPQGVFGYGLLTFDCVVSLSLLSVTGGLSSPYLLYSLAPVLSSALFFDYRTTLAMAVASAIGVVAGYLFSPLPRWPLTGVTVGYFFVYLAAVVLAALLPYVVNDYVRRQIIYEEALQERRRLSREIHDGVAQTASAVCWQVQVIQRRLSAIGLDLPEVRELAMLSEKARYESRECLELLRNYTGDGSFLPHLRDYLEHLSQDSSAAFKLESVSGSLGLDARSELELLRICQEALTNARRHSGATSVTVTVGRCDGRVAVSIVDDGRGFDTAVLHGAAPSAGNGLKVMVERAQSIGGKCQVLSVPGRGTEVKAEVPVSGGRKRISREVSL